MTTHDKQALLNADPVGLTVKEMLLRLDAKVDGHDARIRLLEDNDLRGQTERKTIKAIALGALATWPVVAFILINVIHIS